MNKTDANANEDMFVENKEKSDKENNSENLLDIIGRERESADRVLDEFMWIGLTSKYE